MLRLPFYLMLSVALHAGVGWLLREFQVSPGKPLTPAEVTMISLAPLPAAPAAPAVAAVPVAPPRQSEPPAPAKVVPPPAKSPTSVVERRPEPKPVVAKAPPRPEPERPSVAKPLASSPVSHENVRAQAVTPSALPSAPPKEVLSTKPRFLAPPSPPRYPSQARRRNQEGVVLLEVRLDELGRQLERTLLRSSGVESLDLAALDAVSRWQFHPETVDGRAVPSRIQIPVQFALKAGR
ncbi:energy transducer TonB [Pseudomonas sp. GD03944]|uniref:energy transducer TonB n=1 Tax=Pseudomonas sp. GD03944 TaxID=2975409 RepID=UPI002447D894|nr:energy transducer TonB [Pseudomonas sp. GD03944]MDH1265559.1 energy transducer TonB [Pseudomonas sp. GD03944]